MKNKLTFALLSAGLFLSVKSYAAGECLGISGSIVQFLDFPGSSCPTVASLPVSGFNCELARTGDFVCIPNGNVSTGGPWRYTGTPFGTENPDPDGPPPIPQDYDVTIIHDDVSPSSAPDTDPTPVYAANKVGDAVVDFSLKMSKALKQMSYSDASRDTEIARVKSISETNFYEIRSVGGQVSTIRNNLGIEMQRSNDRYLDLNTDIEIVKTALNESALKVDSEIIPKLDAIKEVIDHNGVKTDTTLNEVYFVAELADGAKQAALNANQQLSDIKDILRDSDSGGGLTEDQHELLAEAYQNSEDMKETTKETLRTLLQLDFSGGSTDLDLTETNEKLDTLIHQSSLTAQNTSLINNNVVNATSAINELNQNVVDSALNTQQAISGSTDELLAELTAIKDALENGSSEYDDTEVNQKLTELINNTGTTGTNVVTSAQATQQAVSASGQQVTDAVNGLGDKLDGIGEGIDSLSDSLKPGTGQKAGPTLCTGDDCYKGKSWVTPKYPEGISSIYEDHKTKFQDSTVHEYLKGFNPTITGTAPTEWEFCFNFQGMANLGCHTASLSPNVIPFVRLVILITAGFLCRRLIFGG